MITRDELLEIYETLKKHKARTMLTAFGVFWGIFMLLLLLGTGDGLEKGVTNMFRGYDLNSFHIFTRSTRMPYLGVQENRSIRMTDEDMDLISTRFKSQIKYVGARSYLTDNIAQVKNGRLNENYDIYGADPDLFLIRKVLLKSGRYFNNLDNIQNRFVAIIGSEIVDELYEGNDVIGQYIQISDSFYKIVGVFESIQIGEEANYQNKTIFIPHNTFQDSFNRKNTIDNIGIVSTNDNVENEIVDFLKKRHKVHPRDEAIFTWNTKKEFSKFQGLFKAIRVFIWVIGIGTLLSGIVGVSNIMVININERTKEIGIRKALGATPFSLIKMIVLESIFLTGLSGYLGLSVGLLLVEIVNYMLIVFDLRSDFFLNPEINLFIVVVAIFTILLAGFFAALFPARKAALIKPIEALREN